MRIPERGIGSQIARGIIVVMVGLIIWFLPIPSGVKKEAWHLLAIFVATIVGLILTPLPMGAMVIIGVMMTGITETVKIGPMLSGFANSTVWLIVVAFLIARGFIKTGLGTRISYYFIRAFGRKTLGLAYAIAASDLVIAPATPSNTARAGGIIYPILRSLSATFGSEPGVTSRKIGAYLVFTEYQVVVYTSAMFMTAMAPNPLIAELAQKTANVSISWGMWALAAFPPGILSLIIVPYLLYKIFPPEIKSTPEATELARRELAAQDGFVEVGDVHGATLAVTEAGLFPGKFRQASLQVARARDGRAVAPVGGGNVIVVIDGGPGRP